MKKYLYYFLIIFLWACEKSTQEDKAVREPISVKTHTLKSSEEEKEETELINPIEHGSFMLKLNNRRIYVDPMGNSMIYADQKPADIVVITHYHPDYLVPGAMESLLDENTKIIVPSAVEKILPVDLKERVQVLKPDQDTTVAKINFKSISLSNEKSEKKENGFLITNSQKKILISGENQHLAEIPIIENLDIILFRMNLTTAEELEKNIEELLKLNPKQIYPYYYEGIFTYNYAAKLKRRIEERNSAIEVKILNWYKDPLH